MEAIVTWVTLLLFEAWLVTENFSTFFFFKFVLQTEGQITVIKFPLIFPHMLLLLIILIPFVYSTV